jgi:hypothetical protein
VGLGTAEIDATYQKARSPHLSATVTLDPRGYTVSGVVRDERGELLPGARVTCCSGGFPGNGATADGSGQYRLDGVSGTAYIDAFPPNYPNGHEEPRFMTVSVMADLVLDIKLLRRLDIEAGEHVASSAAWDDNSRLMGCDSPCRVITLLGPRGAGTLTARLEWSSSDRLALSIADDDDGTNQSCCEPGESLQFHYKGQTTWIFVNFKSPTPGATVPFTLRTTLER